MVAVRLSRSAMSTASTHLGRGLASWGTRARLRRQGSDQSRGRCRRRSTGTDCVPLERKRPIPPWQLTVRPRWGTKRRCTPQEWSPRLGRTVVAIVQAWRRSRVSVQRASSRRTGSQSQGLELTNCWSDCEAVGESVTAAVIRLPPPTSPSAAAQTAGPLAEPARAPRRPAPAPAVPSRTAGAGAGAVRSAFSVHRPAGSAVPGRTPPRCRPATRGPGPSRRGRPPCPSAGTATAPPGRGAARA